MTVNVRRHLAAWLVVPVLAVINGGVRDLTYGRALGRTVAHSISVVPLVVAIVSLAALLERRWPLADRRSGVRVGAVWLGLTLAFEFGLGAALHVPLGDMLAAYDVTRGHLWPLVPIAMALAPELARRGRTRVPSMRAA